MPNPLNQNKQQLDMNTLYQQFAENPKKYLPNVNFPPEIKTPEQMVMYMFNNHSMPVHLRGYVNQMLGRK